MKRALLLSLLLLTACRAPETNVPNAPTSVPSTAESETTQTQSSVPQSVRVETEGDPELGDSPVIVYVLGPNNDGVSGATVEVTGDMTHAGMVPVVATATESAPGLYRANDFEFTMAGDWVLTAEVTLPDGSKEIAEASVTVPGQ